MGNLKKKNYLPQPQLEIFCSKVEKKCKFYLKSGGFCNFLVFCAVFGHHFFFQFFFIVIPHSRYPNKT